MITHENIEEYIIDYLSDELNESEKYAVEEFLQNHPEYHELVEGFQSTFLDKTSFSEINYTKKEELLKTATKMNWIQKLNWKYAASIALIIASGAYFFYNNSSNNSAPFHSITKNKIDNTPIQTTIHPPLNSGSQQIANNISIDKNVDKKTQPTSILKTNELSSITTQDETVEKNTPKVQMLSTLQPIQYKLEKQELEIVIYTQYISSPSFSESLISQEDKNELEVAIGNTVIDVNMDRINDLKENIDNLKDAFVNKVEDSSLESFNLWDIISK